MRLAESVMSLDSARALLRDAAAAGPSGWADQTFAAHSYAVDEAFSVAVNAVRVAGGHGYLESNPVEQWLREVQSVRLLSRPSYREMRKPSVK
jgi:alkylation response protein AidB-like acyl-CoA dehydrogenase